MALSAKRRQQKAEKKNAKRKRARKSFIHSLQLEFSAAQFARSPVHECLIAHNLFDIGAGSVVVAKRAPDGMIAVGAFVLDVFCLGVKNAMFTLVSEREYEQKIKGGLDRGAGGRYFEAAHATCVKKLIEGAVAYAQGLGFKPNSDYHAAIRIIDNIDAASCPVSYSYGREGKPLYVQGPYETPYRAKKIIDKLRAKCGYGGYDYIIGMGEDIFDQDDLLRAQPVGWGEPMGTNI